jgi:hypothetical protein
MVWYTTIAPAGQANENSMLKQLKKIGDAARRRDKNILKISRYLSQKPHR